MRSKPYRRQCRQQGYVMMALLLAVALVLIALAAGLPAISAELKRRREELLIHRGVQYTRAIRRYYRKNGRYPLSLDQLEDSNHLRYLRKRYKDPMTDGDFRLLHVGEVQLTFTPAPAAPGQGPLSSTGLTGNAASNGQSASSSSQPFFPLSAMGAASPSFGGGPIMGVASTSDKQSFRVFNDKDHYNDWMFVYSPALDGGGLLSHPFDGAHDMPLNRNLPGPAPVQPTGVMDTRAPGTVPPTGPGNRPWPIRR